jgi:hypothetical protein
MQYGGRSNCVGTEAPENGQKQGSARTFETIENTGSGPLTLTFDYRPMLAVGLPKPPLAENFDFEVGRFRYRCPRTFLAPQCCSMAKSSWETGSVESFNVLLRRARLRGRSTSNALPATFVAFDLLWHEGLDRTQRPLEKRRSQLRAIVTESERFAVSRVYADRDSGNECRDRRVALERDTGTALPRTSS